LQARNELTITPVVSGGQPQRGKEDMVSQSVSFFNFPITRLLIVKRFNLMALVFYTTKYTTTTTKVEFRRMEPPR